MEMTCAASCWSRFGLSREQFRLDLLSSLRMKTLRWPELPKGLTVTVMPPQSYRKRGEDGDFGEEVENDDDDSDPD